MRFTPVLATLALTFAAAACGGDDDDTDVTPVEPDATDSSDDGDDDDAVDGATGGSDADDGGAAAVGGSGSATITLDNGESFEFSILCALEPQMAAGSEILFSVTSYDDPGMDATQFGDDGTVTGIASITIYDGSYETLYEASTFNEAFGGSIELSLDGSTVSGSGSFFPEADPTMDPVEGELVANC
jgi:hypothetical protein